MSEVSHTSVCRALAAEDRQQEAGRDGGADDAGHVGAHGVHQQEVGGVLLLAHHLGHAGRHRHGGHAGGADQRVDLAAGQGAHDVARQQAAHGGDAEGHETEDDDLDGLKAEEVGRDHRSAHGGGEHDGDDGLLHYFIKSKIKYSSFSSLCRQVTHAFENEIYG